jgi:multidrug resistance efflux pump
MGRIGRVALGMGMLGLGAWSLLPGMIHPIDTDAVVNADVVTLRAPVEGQVMAAGGANVGERVAAGQVLARVDAVRPETARRDGLAMELAGARRLAEALSEEQRDLDRLDDELAGRGIAYRAAARQRLALARAESEARLAGAEAAAARTAAELTRKQLLAAKDLVAPVAVEAAQADHKEARAAIAEARAELAQVKAELSAVKDGIFVVGANNDAPYADQRRDEVRIKRAARRVDAAQAETRVAELARQLDTEQAQADKLSRAELIAPAAGVVWQRFAAEGDTVRPGDALIGMVDCDRLFLTAVLPRRHFSQLKSGDRARAKLSGIDHPVRAVVQSVRAAGGAQANGAAAVIPAAEEGREVVVTLAILDASLGSRSDNLCQVGQQATVTFQLPALKPLIDAMAGLASGWAGRAS